MDHKIIITGVRSVVSIAFNYLFKKKPIIVGVKPGDNNNIFVPRCIWLIIDYPLPRIRALRIDGVVQFQQV